MSAQHHQEFTPIDAGVGFTEVVADDIEPAEASQPTGLVRIGQHEIQTPAALGVYIQSTGTIKVSCGLAMLNQQMLQNSIQVLTTQIQKLGRKPKTSRKDLALLAQLSQAHSRLAAQLTASQHFLVGDKTHSSLEEMEEEMPRVKTFEPGAEVWPASGKP